MCMCVFKFLSEITEPIEDKVHVGPTRDRGNIYSNDSGQLSFFILILPASGGRGLLAGILPQIWPGSAGLLAGL